MPPTELETENQLRKRHFPVKGIQTSRMHLDEVLDRQLESIISKLPPTSSESMSVSNDIPNPAPSTVEFAGRGEGSSECKQAKFNDIFFLFKSASSFSSHWLSSNRRATSQRSALAEMAHPKGKQSWSSFQQEAWPQRPYSDS